MSEEINQQETRDVKIADLKPYDSRINVAFKVLNLDERREITSAKTGETHTVCDVTVGDETGTIIMALWDDDIDLIEEDGTAKIINGHVNVFKRSLRLSKGKYGSLEANIDVDFESVNSENNRSDEEHEPRRRFRRSYGDRGGGRRGGYGQRDRGGYNQGNRW
ncbi:MAG: single-stranded DNA-binding protein [Candidatus Hodarchaeales archaeon]